MRFQFMWAEENYNYYDLASILLTYGLRSKKRFGYGINNGLTFGKGTHAEFYLPEEELKREAECWLEFFMKPNKLNFLLNEIKISEKDAIKCVRALVNKSFIKLSDSEFWDFYDFFGFRYGRLMSCYITTQPHRVVNL